MFLQAGDLQPQDHLFSFGPFPTGFAAYYENHLNFLLKFTNLLIRLFLLLIISDALLTKLSMIFLLYYFTVELLLWTHCHRMTADQRSYAKLWSHIMMPNCCSLLSTNIEAWSSKYFKTLLQHYYSTNTLLQQLNSAVFLNTALFNSS